MIRCVIIDDEFHCIETLQVLLEKSDFDVEVLGAFEDTDLAIDFVNKSEIDVLFIDIQMPKLNGFEFVEKVVRSDISIVFTTSYSDYAVKAFGIAAFAYLLKPISQKELNVCLERWLKANATTVEMPVHEDKIALPSRDSTEIINLDEVVYCKSDNNYTLFNLLSGKSILICRTIKSVNEALQSRGFLRVHQSYVVNTNYIVQISKTELTLKGGVLIPLSKNYIKDLNKHFIQINK